MLLLTGRCARPVVSHSSRVANAHATSAPLAAKSPSSAATVSARSVVRAFFPLDDELALLPGRLTPTLHGWLVRLSSYLPFARAAALLSEFARVPLSEGTAQRLTYAAGTTLVAHQTLEADQIIREAPAPLPGPDCLLLSADGAMVPLLKGEWTEVKTLVAGVVEQCRTRDGSDVPVTTQLSSFSRMVEAERFSYLATLETYRRGVERAGHVIAISDGAEWLQKLFEVQCPTATRILDFPHAAQRLSHSAGAVFGEGTEQARSWYESQQSALKSVGPQTVLAALDELVTAHPELETLAEDASYLRKRAGLMDYPSYQARGWPIASGCVESANKLVVEARLKGAGMHWARAHVNPMVALRNVVCSERWQEEWPKVQAWGRAEARQARRERHKRPAQPSLPISPPEPRVPLPSGKAHPPPANHPWKRKPACAGGMRHNLAQRALARE